MHTLILKTLKCRVLWVICQFDEHKYSLFGNQLMVAYNLEIKDWRPSSECKSVLLLADEHALFMSSHFCKLPMANTTRCVATCQPGKPGLTSFSETLALFFIQFLSFQ